MPNDLVSRVADKLISANALLEYISREHVHHSVVGIETLRKAIAALPAAGDERWEKLRAFIEVFRPSCGDTVYAVGLQNGCDAIDNAMDRISPPTQEAGDEPV